MPYHILLSILISLLAITPHANANPLAPGAGLDNRNPQWYYGHPNHHTNTRNRPPTTTMTPTTTTQTITPPTIISVPGVTTVEETIDLSFFPSTTTTIVPPTIISVPGVTTVYETVDLGVTNQPRGTGRSLPVQPTAFVAVIKRT